MKFKKLCFALLFSSGFASAEQCVQQRYQITGFDLVSGDVVELNVGGESVSL